MKCRISDLFEFSQGMQVSVKKQSDHNDGLMQRFIRIVDYTKYDEKPRYILRNENNTEVNEKDLVMIRYGSKTAGKVVRGIQGVIANNMFKLKPKIDGLNLDFMFYLLSSPLVYNQVIQMQSSSTMPAISFKMLDHIWIQIPSVKTQQKIADTLSALDDKIETNNKINENLEAQAQVLFKHWFVDFEFPNEDGEPYQSSGGEMVESELGMIPSVFEVGSLGKSELGNLMTSGVDSYEGEKIYLATADVSGRDIINHETIVTMDNKPSRANMQPEENTVWFAKMKDSRKLILVDQDDRILQDNYIFSTGFAGIKATDLSIYYLWTYLQSDEFDEIKNLYTTGTTMQAINNKNIRRIQIAIPTDEVLEKFNYIVQPMYKKIIENRNENIILSELRDTLLPKLMSGELRIPLD